MEVVFAPSATHTAVSAIYPGAKLDPLPEPARRNATPAEAAELRALVALVLADAGDADREEALAVPLADPEAALVSFRALANQR